MTYQEPTQSPVYGEKILSAKRDFEWMLSTVKAEDMAAMLESFTMQLSNRLFGLGDKPAS
ncbi:hypothetical protein PQQ53_21340 [Paraburkholderia strydomiana]|uniref:hypothetical protein n=1 Tax=Paraburkholderia strydomiana TaxID=1245417 RepID=UPI0038BC1387